MNNDDTGTTVKIEEIVGTSRRYSLQESNIARLNTEYKFWRSDISLTGKPDDHYVYILKYDFKWQNLFTDKFDSR